MASSKPVSERRIKRSADPLVALHYQLADARTAGSMEALVLADTSGVVVAGAGSWAVCEEIAAYAPLFLREDPQGFGARVRALQGEVEVYPLSVDGQDVLLCALGGSPGDSVARAAIGIKRILQRAA
jgi:hypothetical protein